MIKINNVKFFSIKVNLLMDFERKKEKETIMKIVKQKIIYIILFYKKYFL